MRQGFNQKFQISSQEFAPFKIAGENLLERMQLIKQSPQRMLDLGCGTGELTEQLSRLYTHTQIIGCDISDNRLAYAKNLYKGPQFTPADMHCLPFADNSFDTVFSNMALHWATDLNQVFHEIQRVLKPEGLLLFSSLGPDTLQELRHSFAEVDNKPHVNIFLDMHEIGDAMLKAGLKDPVMDVDFFTFNFNEVEQLTTKLRQLGEINYHPARSQGLMSKVKWQKIKDHYALLKRENGKLPASFEIIYGHALGNKNAVKANNQSEVYVPLSQVLKKPS